MIKNIRDRFGKYSLFQLIGYPFIVLIVTPYRLVQSLWNSRVLLSSKISDYAHFNIHTGLNSLFYHTRALNLKRFGRSGKSPYLGLGDFNLARCFHYSLFSLYGYWKGGAALVLLCMLGWWGSMFLFIEADVSIIDGVLLFLILISTNFYANTFRYQNYNAVGWLFFPLFIFGLLKGYWLTVGIALLLSSFGSFTVVVLGGVLAFSYGVYCWSFWPIAAALPAAIKLLFHFFPFLKTGDTKKVLVSVLKAIGLSRGKAKYKRQNKGNKFTIYDWYHLLLITQFILVFYFLNTTIPFLLVVGMGILIINTSIIRFADEQSMYMLLFTLSVIYALSNPSWIIAISMWLAISPLPFLTGFDYDTRVLSMVPVMKPFDIKPYMDRMHLFFDPVQKEERVFMSFKDPNGVYENIFEGFRQLIELPSYVANQKSFWLFPEWWTVFELNYEDAPNIWGRSVSEVKSNMIQWGANYAMVYQDSNTELDPQWMEAGFELLSTFDWNEFEEEFKNHKRFKNISLKWFLIKPGSDF